MSEIVMLHVLILSGLDDLKNCKIRNSIILTGWFLGVTIFLMEGDIQNFIIGILDILITIVAAFPLYRFGGIGAGDIKLWSVISLLYGLNFLCELLVCLFILAGFVSLIRLISHRSLLKRFLHLFTYMMYGRNCNSRYYSLQRDGKDNVIPMAPITAAAYFITLIRRGCC